MNRRNFLTVAAVSPLMVPSASWGYWDDSEFVLPQVDDNSLGGLKKAVHECYAYLNNKHNGSMGRPSRTTRNGTAYTTYDVGGIKREGERVRVRTGDANRALRLWFEHLERDARKSGKNIVWRIHPEVVRDSQNPHTLHIRTRVAFE